MFRLGLFLSFFATTAFADPDGYGHMMDGSYGYGFGMMFGPILWIIVLGLVVVGVSWIVRSFENGAPSTGKSAALAALDLRFAHGEIDADEYAARKKFLSN